uniref:C2H2-type domain-containing protein n=1 Tax=Riboviria sp. TaxID=2585031 RepID=A0A8K1WQC5_9VIRU|nr:MAG: hypothetical protein 1 [Riboviria sp.]
MDCMFEPMVKTVVVREVVAITVPAPAEESAKVVADVVAADVKNRAVTFGVGMASKATELLAEYPKTTATVLTAAVGYGLYRACESRLHKISRSLRGISGEAARAGSAFVGGGGVPSYQVALYDSSSMFRSKFIGYGIRVADVLVTLGHVVRDVDVLVATGPGASQVISAAPARSLRFRDIVYYHMPSTWWSTLGVKSANKVELPPEQAMGHMSVAITGREGRSEGVLKPSTQYVGKVQYSGSTVPGYSGAAYVDSITGKVAGIHQGVDNNTERNIGYMWKGILIDVHDMFYPTTEDGVDGESASRRRAGGRGTYADEREQVAVARLPGRQQAWGYGDLEKLVASEVEATGSAWDRDDFDIDYDEKITWESARPRPRAAKSGADIDTVISDLESMSQSNLEAIVKFAQGLTALASVQGSNVVGHSDESVEVKHDSSLLGSAVTMAVNQCQTLIESRVQPLEKRVTALESRANQAAPTQETPVEVVQPQTLPKGTAPVQHPNKCDKCNRSFSTALGLITHKTIKHQVSGERATATRPFLGKQKYPSTQRASNHGSSTVEPSREYSRLLASQEKTHVTLQGLQSSFEKLAEIMTGLARAQSRN